MSLKFSGNFTRKFTRGWRRGLVTLGVTPQEQPYAYGYGCSHFGFARFASYINLIVRITTYELSMFIFIILNGITASGVSRSSWHDVCITVTIRSAKDNVAAYGGADNRGAKTLKSLGF